MHDFEKSHFQEGILGKVGCKFHYSSLWLRLTVDDYGGEASVVFLTQRKLIGLDDNLLDYIF